MPTLVHPWTEAAKLSVLRKYVYDNSVDIFVAATDVSDLIIGSRGGIDESMLAEANDALDTHFVRADDVIRLGAFDGVEMVATYQHGEMASEETLIDGGHMFGYTTCETYGRCQATPERRMYVGSRCSHLGLEGLCYASSARTLECGRATNVHSRHAPLTAVRAPNYASGQSIQTLTRIRPCPWRTTIEAGGATFRPMYARRLLLAGCMVPDDNNYERTAEVHLPQACAIPTHFYPGCLFPGALNYMPGARESALCKYPTSGCTDPTAINYNARATQDDGSCLPGVRGCTLPALSPFSTLPLSAADRNLTARSNATDALRNESHSVNAVSERRTRPAAMMPRYVGIPFRGLVPFATYGAVVAHNPAANVLEGCVIAVEGCMDVNAANFDPNATINQGSWCVPRVAGCLDPVAFNYNPFATVDNVSACVTMRRGCTSPTALNFDVSARHPGYCYERVQGCLDPTALNYRCGTNGATMPSPCAMDSSHSILGGFTASGVVTVHAASVCNYFTSSTAALAYEIDGQIASAELAAANDPTIRAFMFRLEMEYVADADVSAVSDATLGNMHRTFTQLHPARDPMRTGLAVRAGSVVFTASYDVYGATQLRVVRANLGPHTASTDALNAFLAATGAPDALTLPRFNVTFYKTPPLLEAGSGLTLEGSISLSVFVIAIAIGIGAALVVYMLRQRRLALAKIFPEASEETSQIEKLQMTPRATRAGGRARPEVQLTPNVSPMPSPPPSARGAARAASYMDTAGATGAEHQAHEHEGSWPTQ